MRAHFPSRKRRSTPITQLFEQLETRIVFSGDIDLTGYTSTFTDNFDTLSMSTSNPKGSANWYGGYQPNGPAGVYGNAKQDQSKLSVSNGILSNKLGLNTGVINTGSFAGGMVGMKNSGGTAMITMQTAGTQANNRSEWQWYGWIGTKFTVGSSPVTISQLGRMAISGNTQTHEVRLFNATTGDDVARTNVNLSGQSGMVYGNIVGGAVTLAANTSYYLLTDNYKDGDMFYNGNTAVTSTGGITINDSRWGVWSSGKLFSVDSTASGFTQKYGYFSMRAKMPASGTGAWPSFWMKTVNDVPSRNGNGGEIDILEWYGNNYSANPQRSLVQQASHNWTPGNTDDGSSPRLYANSVNIPDGTMPWDGYHVYGFKADPTNLTWYIDGVQTNQIATPHDYMTHPYFMILESNINGGWPLTGLVANSSLDVDWVKVYSLPSAPAAPTSLSAATLPTGQVNLTWNDNATNETSFRIERATDSAFTQNVAIIGTAPANATSYADSGFAPSTTYYYRVRANGGGGDSANTNTASATTLAVNSVLLSQGKTATASSVANSSRLAQYAVDGNTSTRWASAYTHNEWLQVDLGQTHTINRVTLQWEAAYGKSFKIQTSDDGTTWTDIYSTTTGTGGTQDLTGLSGTGRYVRMLGIQRGTQYGYSLWEFRVYGAPVLLSQGKTATASSTENASRAASNAFDGNTTSTRWASTASDDQWLQIDLGATYRINQVKLTWEAAYAKKFKLQVSNDGVNWTDLYSTTAGQGGVQDLTGLSGSGRYVRMLGIQRATNWGYSLWEMQVYGS
jgi:beta-glucanase (GH16 family)